MKVPMATTNLFYDPVFKDGAFTSNDPRVRLYALQKTMRSMDLGAELGAHIYVFWAVAKEPEVDAAKDAREALKWNREALNFLCEYSIDQGYDYKFALEAKPTSRAVTSTCRQPVRCLVSSQLLIIRKWLCESRSGSRANVGVELLPRRRPGGRSKQLFPHRPE
jgi:hypothetical protein